MTDLTIQPGIIHLEHHQGWSPGNQVHIFLSLCQGSLSDLLSDRHTCNQPISIRYQSWFLNFADQILGPLDFIHKQGMIHRDPKPDSILYDTGSGANQHSFYISDFGLTLSKSSVQHHGVGGTRGYIAPEGIRYGEILSKSDVYSMGIIMLEIFDAYCYKERRITEREWQDKLKANGVKNYRDYQDKGWKGVIDDELRVYSRIQSLVDHKLITSSLRYMLEHDPKNRPTASEARHDLMDDCKKDMKRVPARRAEPRQRADHKPRVVTAHPHRRDHEEHEYVNVGPRRHAVEPADLIFDFRDNIRPPPLKRRTTHRFK